MNLLLANELGLWMLISDMGIAAVICLVLGLALVIFEMFTPGFAVPGITGLLLLIATVVMTVNTFAQGLVMVMFLLVILTVMLLVAMRSASKGALARSPLVHQKNESTDDGFTSNEDMNYFLGKKGIAATTLRPAGIGDFDGVKLDVLSEGEFIVQGSEITIVKVEGRRIVVRG